MIKLFFKFFYLFCSNYKLIPLRRYILIFLVLSPIMVFCQQGRNIDLDEVVNTAGIIPRINIDGLIYSIRDRDRIITNILKSPFWEKGYKFTINLEDYDTGKKYSFQNKGRLRVFINNIELTPRHNFKTYKTINEVLKNSEDISIISSSEFVKKESNELNLGYVAGQPIYSGAEKEEVPVTYIKISSILGSEVVYNKTRRERKKVKKLSDFKVISEKQEIPVAADGPGATFLQPGSAVAIDQVKSIELDNVDLTQNIEDDGVVYTPKLVNGQITFTKNSKLTRIKKQSERYKRMGLNEWGIDVNANTWAQALRAHLKGKQTFVTSDGFPVLFAAVTLGSRQPGPLWVVDGVYLNEPPIGVRSLAYLIREVNVYKYDTAKFGSRGAAGVIEIFTLSGFSESTGSYKRSFEVKGKENIKLMKEFQSFEKQFLSRREELNDVRKILIQLNEPERVDSIQGLLQSLTLKSYLFTANFAINNADFEIAPYLALTKISDAQLPILESIEEKLSPQVRKSKHGKRFIEFLENKKRKDSTNFQ